MVKVVTTPIPLTQLIPQPEPVPETQHKQYQVDTAGHLTLRTRPTCYEIIRMLPFPFLSLGCCCASISVNSDIIFDDNTRHVHVHTWPGYMSHFSTESSFEYDNIGNVAVEEVGYWLPDTKGSVARYYYSVVLIMTDGQTRVWLTKAISLTDCETELYAIHEFIFGRNNSQYTSPALHTLLIKPDPDKPYPSYYKFYM
mgnify:FL=1